MVPENLRFYSRGFFIRAKKNKPIKNWKKYWLTVGILVTLFAIVQNEPFSKNELKKYGLIF